MQDTVGINMMIKDLADKSRQSVRGSRVNLANSVKPRKSRSMRASRTNLNAEEAIGRASNIDFSHQEAHDEEALEEEHKNA